MIFHIIASEDVLLQYWGELTVLSMQMKATWRTELIHFQIKNWKFDPLKFDRVYAKCLVGSGSKFWFQTTHEKVKLDPFNRF